MATQLVKDMMDIQTNTDFLFDISKTIKYFYETPVIFLSHKDYSDIIFDTMCSMRTALEEGSKPKIIDIIVDFHLSWLHAIKDVEAFSNRLDILSREKICQAISYTLDAICNRLKYYQRYMSKYRPTLTNENQAYLLADIEIIEDMHKEVAQALLEKLKCFESFDTDDEFKIKVRDAISELFSWIDSIHDEFANNLTKYINVNVPHLSDDLTKTLQQIVSGLQKSKFTSVQKLLENLKENQKDINTMIWCTAVHNLEIDITISKIHIIKKKKIALQSEPKSVAFMVLQRTKDYLEKKLDDLESMKITLKELFNVKNIELEIEDRQHCICKDFFQLKIFNHALPPQERERLITELCYVWDLAVFGERSHKSIISILSAADMREEFTDDLGAFFIDQHSRKIYKLPDDETLYQPNERNELVPLTDDTDHIYFYDECGRYFLDSKTRQRVYKAHETASEYMMDSSGILLKVKELRDGVTYYYDNYGRYYINENGKHIYREADSNSEYENDGLGNLVRIQSQVDMFKLCPDDVHVTEEFKYLKLNVGRALRECIADVIKYQPADPIKYLAARLIKYRENMEIKEKSFKEKETLQIEREIRITEERAAAELAAMEVAQFQQGGSEVSYDSNVLKYTSMHLDDDGSVAASSSHKNDNIYLNNL